MSDGSIPACPECGTLMAIAGEDYVCVCDHGWRRPSRGRPLPVSIEERIDAIDQAVTARSDAGRVHTEGCELLSQHRDCAIRFLLQQIRMLQAEVRATVHEPWQAKSFNCGHATES